MAQIINSERNCKMMQKYQDEKCWNQDSLREYRCLNELTIGILGVGVIGKETARILKVISYVRTLFQIKSSVVKSISKILFYRHSIAKFLDLQEIYLHKTIIIQDQLMSSLTWKLCPNC